MSVVIGKAPTLAWVLTVLAGFLLGAFVGTGWSQSTPASAVEPFVGVVVTVEVVFPPTETPEPTPQPTRTPTPDPLMPTPTPRTGGTGNVR
jgi:hypothetical protein